jgi:rhodanese-related sulfurtransferase
MNPTGEIGFIKFVELTSDLGGLGRRAAHSRYSKAEELLAVAARCGDGIGSTPRPRSIVATRGILETVDVAIYMIARPTETRGAERGPRDLGDIMSGNTFSRFLGGSDPDGVSFGDLEEAIGANAWTVVDVREPHEFATGHVPNALNLPMSSFDPEGLPEGKPLVLICQAGARSRNALNRARALGRADVKHFAGGMNGWRSHNGPVTL